MRLSDEQYEEIKRTVIDTFFAYNINYIPINAFEVACQMGITVRPYSFLDEKKRKAAVKYSIDGYSTETDDNEWIIYYNDSCKNSGRINNTIMHEIGHYALGHTNDGDDEEKEAEAKFFAKYALAPPPLIYNVLDIVTPETIMLAFGISYLAAKNAYNYYLNWLNYGGRYYKDYETKMLRLFEVA